MISDCNNNDVYISFDTTSSHTLFLALARLEYEDKPTVVKIQEIDKSVIPIALDDPNYPTVSKPGDILPTELVDFAGRAVFLEFQSPEQIDTFITVLNQLKRKWDK